MKKLPIIGAIVAAVAALFAIKKRKPGDADAEAATEDTIPPA